MTWSICVASLVLLFLILSRRYSPQFAIGFVGAISFVLPAWIILPLFSLKVETVVGSGIDIKVAVAASTLFLYCFLPGRNFPMRLVPSDYAMLSLVAMHLISDSYNSGFRWNDLLRVYAEWFAPYVAGRIAFQKFEDAVLLARVLALLAVMLSVVAMIEAFSRINPMELWAGLRPVEGAYRAMERWGMKRSYGPYFHPIYFGVVQCLLMGAATFMAVCAYRKQAYALWILCPVFSGAGIICTGSRGPIVGGVLLLVAVVTILVPRIRIPMLVFGIALTSFGVWQREAVITKLEKWSGEAGDRWDQQVQVGGKIQKYSGTRGRLLVMRVYGKAFAQAGLIGYGTDRVTGFPISIPLSGEASELIKSMETVENAYLLVALRFGWIGLVGFSLAMLLGVFQWLQLSQEIPDDQYRLLTICLGSSTWAVALVVFTVWMPHEIGFPLVWMLGASSGLYLNNLYLNNLSNSRNQALEAIKNRRRRRQANGD